MLEKEHDLWDFIEKLGVEPTDPAALIAEHKKKMAKTKRVILDSMKDYLIPHIGGKTTGKDKFEALVTLYKSEDINRKRILKINVEPRK
jgi:hypothetical protein